MLADLDLLLTAVFATADDLLPDAGQERQAKRDRCGGRHARGRAGDHGCPVRSRVPRGRAARACGHLIPRLPQQPGYWKRRARLTETIEWLRAMFAQDSPGYFDDVVLLDSTPVECGRSVDTARRSAAGAGLRASLQPQPSPLVLGHAPAPARRRRTARPARRSSPPADQKERDVALRLFARGLHGGELVVCDKGYAGRDFEAQAAERFGATILRPAPQERARSRPRAVLDPPTHRVDLLDAQRPPRPGTPPRAQPARTARPDRHQTPGPQPPASGSTTTSTSRPAPSPPSPPNQRRGINHLADGLRAPWRARAPRRASAGSTPSGPRPRTTRRAR